MTRDCCASDAVECRTEALWLPKSAESGWGAACVSDGSLECLSATLAKTISSVGAAEDPEANADAGHPQCGQLTARTEITRPQSGQEKRREDLPSDSAGVLAPSMSMPPGSLGGMN